MGQVIQKAWAAAKIDLWGTSDSYVKMSTSGSTGYKSATFFELLSSGYHGTELVVDIAFQSSPNGGTEIAIFGGLSTQQLDDVPRFSQQISRGSTTAAVNRQASMTLMDLAYCQVRIANCSSSDFHNAAWIYHRPFRFKSS